MSLHIFLYSSPHRHQCENSFLSLFLLPINFIATHRFNSSQSCNKFNAKHQCINSTYFSLFYLLHGRSKKEAKPLKTKSLY
ncbi:hypothetical protein QL285_032059 [Trifolium repens]|nr:hypothetical protein QL285_032059 [Trifolium repens]